MSDLRSKFEEWANSKEYNTARVVDMGLDYYVDDFINGAWFVFQERQEKIDAIVDLCNNNRGSIHWQVDSFIEEIEEILK